MYNRCNCDFRMHDWLDKNTFAYEFGYFEDEELDEYHIEVVYRKDKDEWYFIRVYEHQVVAESGMSVEEKDYIKADMSVWMKTK